MKHGRTRIMMRAALLASTILAGPASAQVLIDTNLGTINGRSSSYNGTRFTFSIANDIGTFVFNGDLNIPAGTTVTASGSNIASLLALNNVNVGAGVTFDFSATDQKGGGGGLGGGLTVGPTGGAEGGGGLGSHTITIGGTGGNPGFASSPGFGAPGSVSTFATYGNPGNSGASGNRGYNGVKGGTGSDGSAAALGTGNPASPAQPAVGGAGGAFGKFGIGGKGGSGGGGIRTAGHV